MNSWWTLDVATCLAQLKTDVEHGLDNDEAQRRLAATGPNMLIERGAKSPWSILLEQFTGIMVIILIVAAIVSAFLGEFADAIVIGIIVILNALLGLSQEYRAEKAMAALKRMAVPTVKVKRGNEVREISSRDLVPGDIVILETGNLVPADCRLLEAVNLRIQEATLTGESEPVEKITENLSGASIAIGDRRNMAYMGTIVTYGRGLALVAETGMRTELGSIAAMIQSVKRESTPLQKRLEQLGKGLALAAMVIVIIIFAQGLIRGGLGPENIKLMFLTAISMAVAAVPEGLPAVVTIALALGAQRMLRRHALIRKLLAVETLGSVTVICSDKTGTLTENRMTVTAVDVAGHRIDLIELLKRNNSVRPDVDAQAPATPAHSGLAPLLAAGALCNDATLKVGMADKESFIAMGDPTEGALVVAAASLGLRKDVLEKSCPRVAEAPFDSDRKRMTTVHRLAADGLPECLATLGIGSSPALPFAAFCKGATDGLLGVCREVWTPDGVKPLGAESQRAILAANDRMAQNGMRVLGVAFRLLASPGKELEAEQDLIFLGLIGMIDPPRQEVKVAVQTCKTAGIRPVMITGDHPLTAREIARQLGIASNGEILTGTDLDKLSVEELGKHVENVSVYARVSPEHKLKIIEALQKHGHVVAMTGDGVNDAPALRKSDIGVAMGITGTDVAKEASDMVLRDDNFATIVAAVEEGRTIYDNIRKFIKYLLSTNSGELWTMLMAPLVGLPLPLVPIQILWMNLVTDGLPALALGVEPPEKDIMRQKPRRMTDNIFGEGLGLHIVWVGILMAVVTLGIGYWYSKLHQWDLAAPADLAHYRTMIFTILGGLQMGHCLAIRSHRRSLFSMGLRSNLALTGAVALTLALQVALVYTPFLQKFFQTVALSAEDLIVCIVMSSVVFWAVELEKLGIRWRTRKQSPAL